MDLKEELRSEATATFLGTYGAPRSKPGKVGIQHPFYISRTVGDVGEVLFRTPKVK